MLTVECAHLYKYYRGDDKSLAWPGRKQARKHVRRRARFHQHRDASCHQFFFPARQGAEGNSRHSDRNISLFLSWSMYYTNNMRSPSEFLLEESI